MSTLWHKSQDCILPHRLLCVGAWESVSMIDNTHHPDCFQHVQSCIAQSCTLVMGTLKFLVLPESERHADMIWYSGSIKSIKFPLQVNANLILLVGSLFPKFTVLHCTRFHRRQRCRNRSYCIYHAWARHAPELTPSLDSFGAWAWLTASHAKMLVPFLSILIHFLPRAASHPQPVPAVKVCPRVGLFSACVSTSLWSARHVAINFAKHQN